ncbi:hypothetical protein BLNAU_19714 [Blattamonas nauphoetae]|uniref:Uncharacterized protein n=1 Tax=Blattamonas nauphoetae TaxID=2049346 RepID=A0ABQ9X202_9EUKA|nr:hypothetical protein BLNAU_19714 [Blattamonas nauphoetae]
MKSDDENTFIKYFSFSNKKGREAITSLPFSSRFEEAYIESPHQSLTSPTSFQRNHITLTDGAISIMKDASSTTKNKIELETKSARLYYSPVSLPLNSRNRPTLPFQFRNFVRLAIGSSLSLKADTITIESLSGKLHQNSPFTSIILQHSRSLSVLSFSTPHFQAEVQGTLTNSFLALPLSSVKIQLHYCQSSTSNTHLASLFRLSFDNIPRIFSFQSTVPPKSSQPLETDPISQQNITTPQSVTPSTPTQLTFVPLRKKKPLAVVTIAPTSPQNQSVSEPPPQRIPTPPLSAQNESNPITVTLTLTGDDREKANKKRADRLIQLMATLAQPTRPPALTTLNFQAFSLIPQSPSSFHWHKSSGVSASSRPIQLPKQVQDVSSVAPSPLTKSLERRKPLMKISKHDLGQLRAQIDAEREKVKTRRSTLQTEYDEVEAILLRRVEGTLTVPVRRLLSIHTQMI